MSWQESPPSPQFHITEKTPYQQLTKAPRLNSWVLAQIARDIILNGKELAYPHSLNWDLLLHSIRFYHPDDYLYFIGEKAIVHAIARRIGSVAKNMAVGMNAPAIVYASGLFLTQKAEEETIRLNQRMVEITSGQRVLPTPAQKSQALENFGKMREDIEEIKRVMRERSNDFAYQNFPLPQRYTQAIHAILFRFYQRSHYEERNKIAWLLKQGRVEQAYELACQV